ncbi:hypothetical protein [Dysosmobacter sp.]|uniref:hypothetical protein n=1 Tax=Dysosmobacter sp. TaxID=2591382 RepID=UPI003AB16763
MDPQDLSGALSHEELLRRWPKDAYGDPEEPAFLVNLREDGGLWAEMTASRLEACGIPVLRQYPWGGAAVRLYLGTAHSGVDLYVPVSRLDEARQLLEPVPEEDAPAP